MDPHSKQQPDDKLVLQLSQDDLVELDALYAEAEHPRMWGARSWRLFGRRPRRLRRKQRQLIWKTIHSEYEEGYRGRQLELRVQNCLDSQYQKSTNDEEQVYGSAYLIFQIIITLISLYLKFRKDN